MYKRKVLSLQWKSERVMDNESGESMERMEQSGESAESVLEKERKAMLKKGKSAQINEKKGGKDED